MPSIEIPDQLHCLYTVELKDRNGSYVIDAPNRELHQGDLQDDEMYTIALLPALTAKTEPTPKQEAPEPPVQKGAVREVTIEDIGSQGDGIAKVERGYVVIVPETEVGDEVTVEITNVTENFALGEVISDHSEGRQE